MSRLYSAVRAPRTWSDPVGEGAKRTRGEEPFVKTLDGSLDSLNGSARTVFEGWNV
jgi:hypothetical protein